LAKPSSKEKWDLLKRSEREIKQKSSNLQQLVPQNSINPANRGGAVYNPTHRRLRQAGIKFQPRLHSESWVQQKPTASIPMELGSGPRGQVDKISQPN
jgi:hypothetical protein